MGNPSSIKIDIIAKTNIGDNSNKNKIDKILSNSSLINKLKPKNLEV